MTLEELRKYFGELPDDIDISSYDPEKVPKHIAAIMDGNGRWAQKRGLARSQGHAAGVDGVRAAIRTCSDMGVEFLTIYSFSTENWNRDQDEVDMLMELFASTMDAEADGLDEENVRVSLIGDISALPKATRRSFESAVRKTAENTGLTLVIAANYGGRDEIVHSVRSIATEVCEGKLEVSDINEEVIQANLYDPNLPDPDLLIRTSGEFRLSNFLLWQCAYSEMYITDVLWPDVDKFEILRAIMAYQARERRFGKV